MSLTNNNVWRHDYICSYHSDCARDQVVFQDAGRTHSYLCDNGGNYSPLQIIGDLAFCVDSDGFMTTNAVPVADK